MFPVRRDCVLRREGPGFSADFEFLGVPEGGVQCGQIGSFRGLVSVGVRKVHFMGDCFIGKPVNTDY